MDDMGPWKSDLSLKLFIHGIFAAIGGIVRVVSKQESSLTRCIAGAFVGAFTGLVVFLVCQHYNLEQYLTGAFTGIGGYMGSPILDLLGAALRKWVKDREGKTG